VLHITSLILCRKHELFLFTLAATYGRSMRNLGISYFPYRNYHFPSPMERSIITSRTLTNVGVWATWVINR